MKTKTIIATALLTAGLGLGASSAAANASSWHKGTPGFLRNTFYRTKLGPKYVKIGNQWGKNGLHRYEGFKTYRTQVKFYGYQYNLKLKSCHYKHSGHTYVVRGKYGYALKIVRTSKNHLYANTGNIDSSGKGYFTKLEHMVRIY
ncbi:hypothetical protein YK48G_18830 [Lentilactobacillus fungorum]|uniref:Uncharacterized protein n=1 Tax=Lentilactobacillus fungorum TaxID=2201250 RepID=A0ABQ3W0C6_9LACO|nr:hypothetical protein [Lentilactobacillus fungorum]GHP14458.1 hypothetical protein YK48G_18830 [Lentilactobacillus fungorum]